MKPPKQQKHEQGTREFAAIAIISGTAPALDTPRMFDAFHIENTGSPLDRFIDNANELNKIYLNALPLGRVLGNLVLLGYISAVESYVRAIIRGLINIDEVARKAAEPNNVSFAAAVTYTPDLLPDALIEPFSLAGAENVTKTITNLTGIKLPLHMNRPLAEFRKLCQLRHCCTHRFGRLGTDNAITLGLATHKKLLGKPLSLDMDQLSSIAENLRNFVKSLNNAIFEAALSRTVSHTIQNKARGRTKAEEQELYGEEWRWNYVKDKKRFGKYYALFATRVDPLQSPPCLDVYRRFRKSHAKVLASN